MPDIGPLSARLLTTLRRRSVARAGPVRLAVWLGVGYGTLFCLMAIVRGIVAGDSPHRWLSAVILIGLLMALLVPEPPRTYAVFATGSLLQVLDIVDPQGDAGNRLSAVVALALVAAFLAYVDRRLLLALWAVVCIASWGYLESRVDPGLRGSTIELVVPTLLVTSTFGWAVGFVTRSRRAAELELATLADRRRRERVALARELHDSVARDLTIIAMQSAVLRTTDRPAEQDFARAAIEDTARSGLDALKRLVVVLRAEDAVEPPSLVRDLEAESLETALTDSARHLAMLGYQVTVGTVPTDLPRAAETTAVRVVREGTTNITKHAAPGVLCRLECLVEDEHLIVRIDNQSASGTAPQVPSTGLGIESLAERIRLLGGSIVGERVDGTWVLEARIPLTAPLTDSVLS